MKPLLRNLILAFASTLMLCNPANSQTGQRKNQSDRIALPDSAFFNALISEYAKSIDQADTLLASHIWAPTSEISFINPRGTEYGWSGVKNVYKMFRDNFSVRKLSFYNLKYYYSTEISWLTFYWTFDATLREITHRLRQKDAKLNLEKNKL